MNLACDYFAMLGFFAPPRYQQIMNESASHQHLYNTRTLGYSTQDFADVQDIHIEARMAP